MRKILSENTYRHRGQYIMSKICTEKEYIYDNKSVLFICLVNDIHDISRVSDNINRQQNIHSKIIFVSENNDILTQNECNR